MNKRVIAGLLTLLSSVLVAQGQGTFQNLDFESVRANLPTDGLSGYLFTTNALPSWDAYYGTVQLWSIAYNDIAEPTRVGLWDTNSPFYFIMQGNFSVSLLHGSLGNGSISQTGLVPTNAVSLLFSAYYIGTVHILDVSLAGQSLPFVAVSANPNYTVYGADISAFAGQTATLIFSANGYMLDDIQFSLDAIPEPATTALFGLGVFACAVQLVRRRRPKP